MLKSRLGQLVLGALICIGLILANTERVYATPVVGSELEEKIHTTSDMYDALNMNSRNAIQICDQDGIINYHYFAVNDEGVRVWFSRTFICFPKENTPDI